MKYILITCLLGITYISIAQKRILDHSDFALWNTIQNQRISNNGDFIMYQLEQGEKDNYIKIHENHGSLIFDYDRSDKGAFTFDSQQAVFLIHAWQDSVLELKRQKVKKDMMPKDTLAIFQINTGELIKVPAVVSYKLPEKWGGYLAYQIENPSVKKVVKDDTSEKSPPKKLKKESRENGFPLILTNLSNAKTDTFKFVTSYEFAKEAQMLAFVTTGEDNDSGAGLFVYDIKNAKLQSVFESKGKYNQLSWSTKGKHLAFVVDTDTTKALIRPNTLYRWSLGLPTAIKLIDNNSAPNDMLVSSTGNLSFSEDENRLYFGLADYPVLKDTSLLEEEIVNVEVWTYDEPTLYTVQKVQANRDRNKTYTAIVHLTKNDQIVPLESKNYPSLSFTRNRMENKILGYTSEPYELESQWKGGAARNYVLVDAITGSYSSLENNFRGSMSPSPSGSYMLGYEMIDSSWVAYSTASQKSVVLTRGQVFYDEENDSPDYPRAYGLAGWTADEKSLILYDRYDLWEFNPTTGASTRLTKGREEKTVYRYLRLNLDEQYLPSDKWLLSSFNETTKHSGYSEFNAKNKKSKVLISGPYRYSRPLKAQNSKGLIYSRESFGEFPDLSYSDGDFKEPRKISDANPQQSEYNWGSAELIKWTSLDGIELEGLLIKPENFDPNKKYPMIVNFYEKSSDGLFNHRAPYPHRSTINYSFYTSRGYIIFNPDIKYRIGYPGESAYNCVIPGITSLLEKGFIDKERIGVQGHSWGGYQIAYMVTRTNIFRAAESGAPVANMISAYGGIRWGSGLSRQFQYEHTQSRIGGTPWEFTTRYIENSPIYFLDKIETPLLILHNDGDTAVPWYQGIELFTGLRRLGKPSWMLNYNGEPHWPLKIQNRKDFNIRMQQFFDYYLMDSGMPGWMKNGVPALQKGINQGYELLDKK